jgi:hypothetical protein
MTRTNGGSWRWVAPARGQVLACLAYGGACVAGGGADVGDRCVEGVLPEVIGLPPGDLIEQVRLGSPVERRRGQDCVLEFLVCRPRNESSGRNRACRPSSCSGLVRLARHQSSASAARRRKTSPGKVSLRGCSGSSSPSSPNTRASRASPSSRSRRAVAASSGADRLRAIPRREGRTAPPAFRSNLRQRRKRPDRGVAHAGCEWAD